MAESFELENHPNVLDAQIQKICWNNILLEKLKQTTEKETFQWIDLREKEADNSEESKTCMKTLLVMVLLLADILAKLSMMGLPL